MSGEETPDARIRVAYGLIEVLEEMGFDEREKLSIFMVAVGALWDDLKLPVELFDLFVEALKKKILSDLEDKKEPRPS